jgi:hypothetical protein
MGFFLKGISKDYEIRNCFESGSRKDALRFDSSETAGDFLIQLLQDPSDMHTLRQIVCECLFSGFCHRFDDQELIDSASWGLFVGDILIIPHDRPTYEGVTPAETVKPAEAPPPIEPGMPHTRQPQPASPIPDTETHWIRFQIVDDETENPLDGVELTLRLPDGSIQSYTSDSNGTVYIPDLSTGVCDIEELNHDHAVEVVEVLRNQ